MFKHILIPTDGSALSRRAITKGVKLAKSLGARVTGVFAAPPATPVVYKQLLPVGFMQARVILGRSRGQQSRRACAASAYT